MRTAIKELMLSVTNRCNLKCKMCDLPKHSWNELDPEALKKIINELYLVNKSKKDLIISGGEPFLYKPIFDIIDYAKKRNFNVYVPSNGILITKDFAKKIRAHHIDVVNISIEGSKRVHDSIRGKGTFNKAIDAIKNLKRLDVNVTIATTVMKQNYKCLPYVIMLAKNLNVEMVTFQPFNEMFIFDKSKSYQFKPDSCTELIKQTGKILEYSKRYGIIVNPKDYLMKIPKYFFNKELQEDKVFCTIPQISCSIDSEGNAYTCWPFMHLPLGNIYKNSFKNLYKSENYKQILSIIKKEGCRGCLMSCYDKCFNDYGYTFIKLKLMLIKKVKRTVNRVFNNKTMSDELISTKQELAGMIKKFDDAIKKLLF